MRLRYKGYGRYALYFRPMYDSVKQEEYCIPVIYPTSERFDYSWDFGDMLTKKYGRARIPHTDLTRNNGRYEVVL